MPASTPSSSSATTASPLRYTAQAEIGIMTETQAEVESQMYASFSREIRYESVMLRITAPTKSGLK